MSEFSLKQLQQLLDVMEKMHSEALVANWDELTKLDQERRAIMKFDESSRDFQSPLKNRVNSLSTPNSRMGTNQNTTVTMEYRKLTDGICHLDKVIHETVANAKKSLLLQKRNLKAQAAAQKNYAQAQSMTTSV